MGGGAPTVAGPVVLWRTSAPAAAPVGQQSAAEGGQEGGDAAEGKGESQAEGRGVSTLMGMARSLSSRGLSPLAVKPSARGSSSRSSITSASSTEVAAPGAAVAVAAAASAAPAAAADEEGDEDDVDSGEEEEQQEEEEEGEGVEASDLRGLEGMLFNSEAELVRPYAVVPGRLFLSATHLRFVGSAGPKGEGCSQLLEGDWSEAISKDSALLWPLASVKQLHRRRCLMTHTAIELFRDDGDTLMLNLPDKAMRSRVRRWIKRKY